MADHKDSPDPKNSSAKTDDPDWEFNVVTPTVSNETLQNTTNSKISNSHFSKANNNLILDNSAVPRTKTRSAMALDVANGKKVELKDEYNCA